MSWSPRASMKSASNPSKSSISSSSWVNFESVANALDWPKMSFQAFKNRNYRLIPVTCKTVSKLRWISFLSLKIRYFSRFWPNFDMKISVTKFQNAKLYRLFHIFLFRWDARFHHSKLFGFSIWIWRFCLLVAYRSGLILGSYQPGR